MKVLVTGGTGFIGRHALGPLVAAGHEVHAVARRAGPPHEAVTWHEADLLVPGTAAEVVAAARPSRLLHLAWYAEHARYWTAPENVAWVEASLALLRAFVATGGSRAVVAGTCAEYDWTAGDGAFAEDAPLGAATLYGAAKAGLHAVAAAYAAQAGFALAWGRVFFVYGPYEHPDRLVASVARALAEGRAALISSGTQVRDFMHAQDVGSAFAALIDDAAVGPVNVASGEPVAVRDVAATLGRLAGAPELVRVGELPDRPGDPARLVADTSRLRGEIGYIPRYDLERGLANALEWWREHATQGASDA